MKKANSARSIRTAFSRAGRLGAVLAVGALAALAGCTYSETGNPLVRKLSWFSYLNGDDVRAGCRAGGPEHWRFVYNGVYTEQVRAYDLSEQPDGTFRLRVNVANKANLSEFLVGKASDLVSPWRGPIETLTLGRDQRDLLAQAAEASGQFTPAPKGLVLHSDHFYWIGVVCRNGQVSYNAYRWPSPRYDRVTFPALLLAWDPTGLAYNAPHELTTVERHARQGDTRRIDFNLEVGDNGLKGVKPLF